MKVPDIKTAIENPLDFQVTYAILGWSLSYLSEDVSTLITEQQAHQFIEAHKLALSK